MNTITAKELRDNLGEITKRVQAGEHIYVSYRNKLSLKLEPVDTQNSSNPLQGLEDFLSAPKKRIAKKYREKDLKKLYRKEMAKKYGIE